MKSLPKPVGLMACNDVCGREVLQACAMLGIRVPDEVAVVGVDNDELLCDLADPPLSSVALDLESAGFATAELLDRLMSGRPPESRQVLPAKPMRVVERRSTDRIPQGDPMVAAALRFIRDHAGRLIGVADVSEHSGVSRRTLERRFQRALGHGAYEEIARCRMSRAKRLLEETDLPACRVASAAGFGGIQPMMRMFRRREGCTPLEYRRNHVEQ